MASLLKYLVMGEAFASGKERLSTNGRSSSNGRKRFGNSSSSSKMWGFLSFATTVALTALVTLAVTRYFDRRKESEKKKETEEEVIQRKLEARKPNLEWNTVLFFEDGILRDPNLATFKMFLHYLESARATIQMCLYRCSHVPLGEVILKKFNNRKGLLIQVITDYDVFASQDRGSNRLLKGFVNAGISLRVKRAKGHMHHKFVIIDGEAVLTGSLNWTEQAFTSNHEDVLISTNPQHVQKYMNRFKTLWRHAEDPAETF